MKLYLFQVLLIGGSTGSMLEALDVVGGDNDSPLASVGTITVSFTTNDSPFTYFCVFYFYEVSRMSFTLKFAFGSNIHHLY